MPSIEHKEKSMPRREVLKKFAEEKLQLFGEKSCCELSDRLTREKSQPSAETEESFARLRTAYCIPQPSSETFFSVLPVNCAPVRRQSENLHLEK